MNAKYRKIYRRQRQAALRSVCALVCACGFFFLAVPAAGAQDREQEPEVSARAWAVADAATGEQLAGENAEARLPIASTTKIMTALVVLDEAGDLDEPVVVSESAAAYASPAYSNVGLRAGDRLTVRELLLASMLASGNDAAYALAEEFGDGSIGRFVEKMNRKAEKLRLDNTHFENPVGFDAPGHYSTARDLTSLAQTALESPVFREIVDTPRANVVTQEGRKIPLQNTNDLLFYYPPANGVKTGTTPAAGKSLVASAAAEDEAYIAVVLNAPDRFEETEEAFEYGFDAYDRKEVVEKGTRYAEVPMPYREEQNVRLVAEKSVSDLVEEGTAVERTVTVKKELPDAAEPGTELGRVVATVGGEKVGESPLVTHEGYTEASLWDRVRYTVGGVFGQRTEKS